MTAETPDSGPTAGEWADQELALQLERLRPTAARDGGRIDAYRVVARTLAQPLPPVLPNNFAWYVAELARAKAGEWGAEDRRFRRSLCVALVATLGLAAAGLVVRFGAVWALPPHGERWWVWPVVFVACMAGSRVLESLVTRRSR